MLKLGPDEPEEKGRSDLEQNHQPSEQGCGESLSPGSSSRILRAQKFEEIDKFLASVVVALHITKQHLEALLDLLIGTDATAASNISSDATSLWCLGDTGQEFKRFVAAVITSEEFREIDNHIGVVGFEFKRLAKRSFVALFPQHIDWRKLNWANQSVDKIDDLLFGESSDKLVDNLPARNRKDGGDALNLERL